MARADFHIKAFAAVAGSIIFLGPFGKAIIEIGIVLMFFLALSYTVFLVIDQKREPSTGLREKIPGDVIAFGLFFISIILSAFFSSYAAESLRDFFRKYAETGLYFAAFSLLLSQRTFYVKKIFYAGFFAGALVLFIDCIWQQFTGVDLIKGAPAGRCYFLSNWHFRTKGPFPNENVLAAYMLFPVFFSLSFMEMKFNIKRKKLMYTAIVILAVLSAELLFTTYTRGAWIAFLAGFFVYALIPRQNRKPVMVVTAALILFIIALLPAISERIVRAFQEVGGGGTVRYAIWNYSMEMILKHPITGVGFNQFPSILLELNPSLAQDVMHTHNLYLKILTEMGFLGLSFFCIFIVILFVNIVKALLRTEQGTFEHSFLAGFLSAFTATLVYGLFDNTFFSPQIQPIFWMMCAIASITAHHQLNSQSMHAK